jgi:signal transduction histidine kinase
LNQAERLATLGQVAAGIAHELRNPLVGIGSTAALLLDDFPGNDSRRTDIDVILKEAKRLDRIVNQIVEYARPRELAPASFSLSDVIGEVVKTLDVQLRAKHLAIEVTLSPMVGALHADRDQIKQVLLNVIHNAIDASPVNAPAIVVSALELSRQDRPGIMVQVKDGGAGIAPEALSRIFEPFFTTGKRHGTGLGLAICRNILEAHRGDIHMTSDVGKGATVRIWLPLCQESNLAKG